MRDQGPHEYPFNLAQYAQAQQRIRRFKSNLSRDCVEDLAREVIRRLAEQNFTLSVEIPSDDQIEHLCHALLANDDQAGAAFIHDMRSAGASIDAVYLKYLAGAARMLGEWWDDDLVSFPHVTLATSRMYAIMRAMRHQFPIPTAATGRSAVFASVPGEAHTLGLRIATDLFRKDGWKIDLVIAESHDATVCDIVRSDAPLIGFSAGGRHSLQALSRLVIALRIEKPAALLFVSGQVIEDASEAVKLLGVDGMAGDMDTAKSVMDTLWSTLQT
ncbi:MAG: cobalamin-dependent protein [Pseudomonadota bacterium]